MEKLRQDGFTLTASLKTYIMAIAKNHWLKRLRTTYRNVGYTKLHDNRFLKDISRSIEQEKSYWDKLQQYLLKITDPCKGLIDKLFFRDRSIEQIQKEYGYSSRHNAQNKKHKWMEQIRKVKAGESAGG